MGHQGPRTECQLLDSLKHPVLNMLSKQHSINICVHVSRALGSYGNCSSSSGSEAKPAAPHGRPWRAHMTSGPGFCAWPCLGTGLVGEARPAPDTCRVQGVRGLGDSPLTHFSPGCQGVSREGPGHLAPRFSPNPSLCRVCGTVSWEDARVAMELYRISRRFQW